MQFYALRNLWLLSIIPILMLFILFTAHLKEKRIRKFAHSRTYSKLTVHNKNKTDFIRCVFYVLVIVFSVVALCRPQWGKEIKKLNHKGLDILFLLDVSQSMLAQDIQPNRFEQAKMYISQIVQEFKGNRVGLVPFAQQSYLTCPLTLDYSAFFLFLNSVNVGYIQIQGTSIYNALQTAISSLQNSDLQHDVIIILSDGEDHLGGINEIAQKMKSLGVRAYCIGFGTQKGAPIPILDKDKIDYERDLSGNTIITRLEDASLRRLAELTGGLYYQLSDSKKEIQLISDHIKDLQKKNFEDVYIVQKEDQFQIFLIIILLLLIGEICLPEKK
jgi:Ca-activated chloride channel family protein